MKKFPNILCIMLLGFIFTSVFTGNANAVIIGDSLIDRPVNDGALGRAYIYDGGFGINGVATAFKFFDNDIQTNDYWVTPLLLQKTSSTDFVLKGLGTSRNTTGSGIQAYDFGLIAGSDIISPDYTFGFVDRLVSSDGVNISTLQSNTGVVDFEYYGPWRFVSGADIDDFDLQLDMIFRVNGTTSGNVVRLYTTDGMDGRRTYSAQMEANAVPEPASLSLLGLGLLGLFLKKKL